MWGASFWAPVLKKPFHQRWLQSGAIFWAIQGIYNKYILHLSCRPVLSLVVTLSHEHGICKVAFLFQVPPLSCPGWLTPVLAITAFLFLFFCQVSIGLSADSKQPLESLSPNSLQILSSLSLPVPICQLSLKRNTQGIVFILSRHASLYPERKVLECSLLHIPLSLLHQHPWLFFLS